MTLVPVILSGGSGSRLWPLSRGAYPKQFLPLLNESEDTMLQMTAKRAGAITDHQAIVVCNEEHRFLVAEQFNQIDRQAQIVLEPEGKNTAPAVTVAASMALNSDHCTDPVLLVMPADHVIQDIEGFSQSIKKAAGLAELGYLVTLGITPNYAETGYGYIKAANEIASGYVVDEFKEKPDAETAQQYLESGDYFWNAGIFVFKARAFLEELAEFEPKIYDAAIASVEGSKSDLDFIRLDGEAFSESPSGSIDYAVMEKTDKVAMVPMDVGWSDVGSWAALADISVKDQQGNSTFGDVLLEGVENSHIHAETKLVAGLGVKDLVVVETDDAVLITTQKQSQQVKKIVEQLKSFERSQVKHHRKVYRPWGWYDSIDSGPQFQVKRIRVKPGAMLSVQMHNFRAEHWVVVRGQAEVLNGEQWITLNENESTYIPIKQKHALKNPSESDYLEIIEVQTGSYLGEDDIIRFEDIYGRESQ